MQLSKFRFLLLSAISICLFLIQWKHLSFSQPGTDFNIYYQAALQFRADPHSLYSPAGTGFDQYLYPPPGIFIFSLCTLIPPGAAYLSFILLMYSCLLASLLIVKKICAAEGYPTDRVMSACFIVFAIASAPVFHNILLGQINMLVLLLSTLHIYLLKRRPLLSGIFLAVAIWIKLYPLLLLMPALFSKEGRKMILSCAACGLLIFLLSLPWLPAALYKEFVFKLIDTSEYTCAHAINQSLTAFLVRCTLPAQTYRQWPNIFQIPAWIKWMNMLGLLALMGWTILRTIRTKKFLLAGIIVLGFIPIFSTLGWGHTYVFILPLVFLAFAVPEKNTLLPKGYNILLLVMCLLLLIPIYNSPGFLSRLPALIQNVYYARLLLVTLILSWFMLRIK